MSSTHPFIDDVFISYRHLDNELLDEHGKGWIDNFHERFESLLGEALGYEPRFGAIRGFRVTSTSPKSGRTNQDTRR